MELLAGRLDIADLDAVLATLDDVSDRHGVTIQAFDADYVAGNSHLERAVELADRAISRGENVARDRGVEILLYAAGRRQIDRALEMGVTVGEGRVAIVVDAISKGGGTSDDGGPADSDDVSSRERRACEELEIALEFTPEPTLAEPDTETVSAFFEISDTERAVTDATLEELVCERVALLDVEK